MSMYEFMVNAFYFFCGSLCVAGSLCVLDVMLIAILRTVRSNRRRYGRY